MSLLSIQLISKSACHGIEPLWLIDWLPATRTALWLIDWHLLVPEQPCVRLISSYLDSLVIDWLIASYLDGLVIDWLPSTWTALWLIDWLIDCLIDWQLPGQPCDWLTDCLTATWTAWMRWACWSRPSCSGHSWRRPLEYRELDCGHSVQINSTRTCVQHPCVQACTLQSIYIKLAQVKMRHMGAVGNSKTNLL